MSTSRLVRIQQGRILGGVCTGLARYLAMDLTLVRIIVTCLVLFTGIGPFLYLGAWLAMPQEGADQSGLTTLIGGAKSWNTKRVGADASSSGPATQAYPSQPQPQPQETFNPYNS